MKKSVLRDITPCSPLKMNRRYGGTYRLHLQNRRTSKAVFATCFMLVSFLAYSSILRMVATCTSEMSDDCQCTTLHYTLEDRTRHNDGCENLRSYGVTKCGIVDA
jgi:hypothetical protein